VLGITLKGPLLSEALFRGGRGIRTGSFNTRSPDSGMQFQVVITGSNMTTLHASNSFLRGGMTFTVNTEWSFSGSFCRRTAKVTRRHSKGANQPCELVGLMIHRTGELCIKAGLSSLQALESMARWYQLRGVLCEGVSAILASTVLRNSISLLRSHHLGLGRGELIVWVPVSGPHTRAGYFITCKLSVWNATSQ
jgi:hypothetical protein